MSATVVRFPAIFFAFVAIAPVLAVPAPVIAQGGDVEMSRISGDPAAPLRPAIRAGAA